jgi:hypothetical protein
LKTIWFTVYGNDLGDHVVDVDDVDDVIVKRCVEPMERVPPRLQSVRREEESLGFVVGNPRGHNVVLFNFGENI